LLKVHFFPPFGEKHGGRPVRAARCGHELFAVKRPEGALYEVNLLTNFVSPFYLHGVARKNRRRRGGGNAGKPRSRKVSGALLPKARSYACKRAKMKVTLD